jgi:hypothetical protein
VIADPKITAAGDVYTIEFNVENQGFIPTALRQAQLVKIVRPDTLSMVFPAGMTSMQAAGGRGGRGDFGGGRGEPGGRGTGVPQGPDTSKDKVILVEPQNRTMITLDRLAGNEAKPVTFKLRLNGIAGTDCTLRYSSTRGGVVERKIYIGKK